MKLLSSLFNKNLSGVAAPSAVPRQLREKGETPFRLPCVRPNPSMDATLLRFGHIPVTISEMLNYSPTSSLVITRAPIDDPDTPEGKGIRAQLILSPEKSVAAYGSSAEKALTMLQLLVSHLEQKA